MRIGCGGGGAARRLIADISPYRTSACHLRALPRQLHDAVDDVLEDDALAEVLAHGLELRAGEGVEVRGQGLIALEGAIGLGEAAGRGGERGGRVGPGL